MAPIHRTLDDIVRELDAARAGAKHARGERRETLLARLREMDRRLLDEARAGCDPPLLDRLSAEAAEQLAPFRTRMAVEVYARSQQACVDRLIREHLDLPTIAFD